MASPSIVSHLLIQQLCPFERRHDHLTEDGFLLLKVSELLLEVGILLLLTNHAQLESAVERLDEGSGGLSDLLVDVVDLGLHGHQFLPEELDQLVVLLQLAVSLPRQVLTYSRGTSTMPK